MGPKHVIWALCMIMHTSNAISASVQKPNIVLMMADDLGYGDIGCFGNKTLRTPHIDGLAREGVKLTQMLAAASVCTPSRAAFLTGRYPIRMGMAGTSEMPMSLFTGSSHGLQESEVTIAELAKEAGYKTGLIGKWHQGLNRDRYGDFKHHPLNQGFDYFYGIPLTLMKDYDDKENHVYDEARPYERGNYRFREITGALFLLLFRFFIGIRGTLWKFIFIAYLTAVAYMELRICLSDNWKFFNSMFYRNHDLVEQPLRLEGLTKRLVQEGEEFIKQQSKDTPFLLFMSWLQPHTPLHAGPDFAGKSTHGKYGDEVEELDWSVGQILKALKDNGQEKDTLVMFTSDHGGHIEETGVDGDRQGGYAGIFTGGKFQGGMEGGIRVPTVVKWPGHIPPGTESNEPLSLMDFFPTLAKAFDTKVPEDRLIDGKDMAGLLSGEKKKSPHEFLFHYCVDLIHAVRWRPQKGDTVWKVRYASHDYKPGTDGCGFHCHCDGEGVTWHQPPLIFDINKDPSETHPISANDAIYKTVLDKVTKAVEKHKETLIGRPEVNRYTVLWRPWLQPCCNFPYCSCTDSKFP